MRTRRSQSAFAAISSCLLLAASSFTGCSDGLRGDANPNEGFQGCRACHGNPRNAAPPASTLGLTSATAPSVGSHQAHLAGGEFSRPVSCRECHRVPQATDDPGHIDSTLPAEVIFATLSTGAGAVDATWDHNLRRCTNYCHGAAMKHGNMTEPEWNVGGTQTRCGTCHGLPPGGTHPHSDRCEVCHLPTAGPNITVANRMTHIDGVLQYSAGDCNTCHGSQDNAAPPLDTDADSNDPTTDVTVGAHQSHVRGGRFSKPVDCSQCHVVPQQTDDPGHINDGTPHAEVTFGNLATLAGATPAWDRPSATCAGGYCHGSLQASNPDPLIAKPSPIWTDVGGNQAACGACHGLPPATPVHQDRPGVDCSVCHPQVAGPGQTIAQRDLHVDGVVQSARSCDQCHGDQTSSAPPLDVDGDSARSDLQVGSHRTHISGGAFSAPVPCATCHIVPTDQGDVGHIDSGAPAEVTFDGRAAAASSSPVWNTTARTCDGTYCHGANSSPGLTPVPDPTSPTRNMWNPLPVWHEGGVGCGSCHGLPPSPPHPQSTTCGMCHQPVVDPAFDWADPGTAAAPVIAERGRHVDGVVDVDYSAACSMCHGTLGQNAAPPQDLTGDTSGTDPQVGAHQGHLGGTANSRAVDCDECHTVPNRFDDPGHMSDGDNIAELTWGATARADGAAPTWSGPNGTDCTNYCHGATLTGGTRTTVSWTAGPQGSCDTCHGMPPLSSTHQGLPGDTCDTCHETAGPGGTITDAARHVDGVVDASASCSACHGDAGRQPPGNSAPPRDTAGQSSSPKVGAHLAHVEPNQSAPVACDDCHVVPAAYADPGHDDGDGVAEVNLTGRALADGAGPVSYAAANLRCTNTYCHGKTIQGGTNNDQVDWDAGSAESACDRCHGAPPTTSGHAGMAPGDPCGTCHDDTATTTGRGIADPTYHVDGTLQVGACGGSCHDMPETSGAHLQHTGTQGFECAMCHGNNGSGPQHNEGDGTVIAANVDIVFDTTVSYPGGTTMTNGGSTNYDRGSQRCRVGCHNPKVGNPDETPNTNVEVLWSDGPLDCTVCHDQIGNAPPLNHDVAGRGRAGCTDCHDMSGHTGGAVRIADPDPSDSFTPSLTNIDALCKTCHDGGGGSFLGGQSARDALHAASGCVGSWNNSSHGGEGYTCSDCHTVHVSVGNTTQRFVDRDSGNCTASGCHADLYQSPSGPFTFANSHHKVDESGVSLTCVDCHNPHLAQVPPRAASDPDNLWCLYNLPSSAASQKNTNYDDICLACHDGSPPPGVSSAANIAQARASGSPKTQFKKGSESLHRKAHKGWNCVSCHDWHGTDGTAGTDRRRMVLPYMNVRAFPYAHESSCGTPSRSSGNLGRDWNGQWVSYSFGCH